MNLSKNLCIMLQLFQQQSEKAPRELEHLVVDLKRKIKMVINRGIPKWRLLDYTWTIQNPVNYKPTWLVLILYTFIKLCNRRSRILKTKPGFLSCQISIIYDLPFIVWSAFKVLDTLLFPISKPQVS